MLGRLKREKRSRRAVWQARGSGALAVAGELDRLALRALRTRGHAPAAEGAMKALGLAGEYGAIWVALGLAGAAADRCRRARWGAASMVAPAAIVVNFAVKKAVGRQRPVITEHPALAKAPSKLSFPSAHATSSVAAATAYARVRPEARGPLLALAAAICLGRPYLGMHYPSDVVAGAVLGAVLGRLVPLPPEPPEPVAVSDAPDPTPEPALPFEPAPEPAP
ncbi:MAG: phosphatase PAP2 family protein [Solirubrobacterales bacterium]